VFGTEELNTLLANLAMMQSDIRLRYQETLDMSHHGRPTLVQSIHTGRRGRPRIQIDPDFLRWAYNQRTTAGIHRFLNVGRSTVRNALLEHDIAEPQSNPFTTDDDQSVEPIDHDDDFLDPQLPIPSQFPPTALPDDPPQSNPNVRSTTSFTGPLSNLTDDSLDELILRLHSHFRRAGLTMLDGMLRRLGYRVPRERIRESLMRIDPIHRVFQRIRIRRRVYSVPGPNHLWHHDGQHGMHLLTRPIYLTDKLIRSHPMGHRHSRIY
jgi:hypothetical protein